ncbi:SDR family oxidoreductase [Limibacillus sp. MBR-115]|uniref:SDR family oxidoreductase n=1 Tax=Limibacillus sp. MBR-115 TaxID=3156465 RepID=UPI003395388F
MDLGLKGKRALVLASSRGLGLGIAEALCAEGAKVVICGRSQDKLDAAARRLNDAYEGTAYPVVIDLSADNSAEELYRAAKEALGGSIDILVNNTGGPPPGSIAAVPAQVWRQQFDSMVGRVFDLTALVLPHMRAQGWGRILNTASSGVRQPIPNLGISNALRASIVGWAKTLSAEVAGDGVTVNTILPGRIHTERVDELDAAAAGRTGKTVEEVATASRNAIPAGRYGRVEEFAAVAAFLVSEKASYVTGSLIAVDGGSIKGI